MTLGQNTPQAAELFGYIERVEAIRAERKHLAEDLTSVMAAAKAAGFSPDGIKLCVKAREMKPQDFLEGEELRDLYLHAIGMTTAELPLFKAMGLMADDALSRERVVDAMRKLVPERGEIIIRLDGKTTRLSRGKGETVTVDEDYKAPALGAGSASPSAAPVHRDVPDVDEAGAEELGRGAYARNEPIIANPFPAGDRRRARFDQGWREAAGSDGMGPKEL